MQTKLTLRIDSDVIEKAKQLAASRNTSLSAMVSDFFKSATETYKAEAQKTPVLGEIAGLLTAGSHPKSALKQYKKHMEEKYK